MPIPEEQTLDTTELANAISNKFGLPRRTSAALVNYIFDKIAVTLRQGKWARFRNFGSFQMRKSHGKKRPKWNPSPNILDRRLR